MARFVVSGNMTISVTCEVDAENEEEAKAIAAEATNGTIHASFVHGVWTADELDGEPKITGVIKLPNPGRNRW